MQSGTVSVERMWSSLLDMFPTSARCITEEWFEFCSNLAFLRFNYRHYNQSSLPPWCRGDSLLAERIDLLVDFAKQMECVAGGEFLGCPLTVSGGFEVAGHPVEQGEAACTPDAGVDSEGLKDLLCDMTMCGLQSTDAYHDIAQQLAASVAPLEVPDQVRLNNVLRRLDAAGIECCETRREIAARLRSQKRGSFVA